MMEANQIRIHIESGNVMVGEVDTVKVYTTEYKSKKWISTVITSLDTLKNIVDDFLPSIKVSEEEWELDINVFEHLKYFVASYKSIIGFL